MDQVDNFAIEDIREEGPELNIMRMDGEKFGSKVQERFMA